MICKVKTIKGYDDINVYSYDNLPYHRLSKKIVKRRGKSIEYNALPMTLDIESSKHEDIAYMYIWQVCIQGYVVIGRYWQEYLMFLSKLDKALALKEDERKQIIYVHNLSYEFKFITNFINIQDVFATDINKVLTVKSDNFEYRCSYFLSGKSLEKFLQDSKNPHYLKTKEDIDHNVQRTPLTVLTDEEMGYCIIDVLGLYHRLLELLEVDDINTIPLTKTGYVRRDVLKAMKVNKKNRRVFEDTQLDRDEYDLLKECFRGGNTASSRFYCNKLISDDMGSWDLSSSYPFQMLARLFPIGKFRHVKIKNLKRLVQYNTNYCTIGRYAFTNLRIKSSVPVPYIPFSKCIKAYDPLCFNGRVLNSDAVIISLTEVDFEIVKSQYDYDELRVYDFMYSTKGRLPQELIDTLMLYFELKSTLKDVEGMEYEYLANKELLNSMYGMIVQDCINENINYIDNEFVATGTFTDLDDFYKSFKKILPYQWGVWITAHARKQLQVGIDLVGLDCVYTDTDSVKFIDDNYTPLFKALNEQINKECIDKGIKNYIDLEDGKRAYMGTWDNDGTYKKFVTLGAKKYAYVDMNDNLKITVAGLNKKKGAIELEKMGGIEHFKNNTIFFDSGRTCAKYVNMETKEIEVQGAKFITGSYIYIEDVTYTLGISNQMQAIIDNIE